MHHSFLTDQLRDTLAMILIAEETRLDVLFDGDLALRVEYDAAAERLVCSIPLDRRKSEAEESLLRGLLNENSWIGGAGATLSLTSAPGTSLALYASGITGLNDPRFERLADHLLAMTDTWRERFAPREREVSRATHGQL
jgi:hypothetical protein